MRVGLFVTCFNDTLFPQVGRATLAVLERLGVTVDFPAGQTCCGQMHFNSGYRPECVPLVRHFAEVFTGYDAVVTPSASCAAMVRHHHAVVDPAVRVPRVYELCAFHPTCHSTRLLHIGDRPRRLLAAVDGLRLVPLRHEAECCGFGGTFSVKNPDTSAAMGADKVADVLDTGADVLTSADTSCLMHIGGMLSRQAAPVRAMHLAEILATS